MLKKLVFERLNSGGVELSSQETRNAVYNGPLNQLCLTLSENKTFRRMWGIPLDPPTEENDEPDDLDVIDEWSNTGKRMFEKMEDVELVLRFFAYRQISSFKAGLNKISEFLDRFMVRGNQFPEDILTAYREMFESNVAFLWDCLGAEAYCVIGSSRRPTKIVYDPIMYVANTDDVKRTRKKLIAGKDVLRKELETMYQQQQELFAGRRTNYTYTQARNVQVKAAFSAAMAQV